MDKCREAFEAKYRELHPNDKCTLMANGNYSGWVKQAHWWAWQSRQSEFDAMTEALLNQTQLLAKQKVEVEEKDKKLKAVEQILIELKESITNFKEMDLYDKGVRVVTDCIIRDLEKALRGEHE